MIKILESQNNNVKLIVIETIINIIKLRLDGFKE
jgi:hypothetical protein